MKAVKKIKTLSKSADRVVDFLESWKKINPRPVAVPKQACGREHVPVKAEEK